MKIYIVFLCVFSLPSAGAQTTSNLPTIDIKTVCADSSYLNERSKASKECEQRILEELVDLKGRLSGLEPEILKLEQDFEAYTQRTEQLIAVLQEVADNNATAMATVQNDLSAQLKAIGTELSNKVLALRAEISESNMIFNKQISDNQSEMKNLKTGFGDLSEDLGATVQALGKQVGKNEENTLELEANIDEIKSTTGQELENVSATIGRNSVYWIASILVIALALLFLSILFKKLVNKFRNDSISTHQETRLALDEKSIHLDNKLIALIETQLDIIKTSNVSADKEPDHSLALKMADEIVRIQKNVALMDSGIRGMKQLTASVKRIQDNFLANGYEIVEMLGKQYNEGMRVSANFIPDETLEDGQQIITRVIKPQVNYRGVMIQSAQIEVSLGK